ncbi:MAG TPA: site-specific integrase [Candidatus Tectomicrobia bacterium]
MKAKLIASVIKTLPPAEQPYDVRDTMLPNFLLRVQPTGVMTYFFVYQTADGRKTRYRIGDVRSLTPAQARDMAEQLSARVISGEDIQVTKQERRNAAEVAKLRTLGGFLEHKYAPWVVAERKSGTATLARLQHNFAHLRETTLSDITPWLLEKWRSEQLKSGKASSTINRDIVALKALLAKAVDWNMLDKHPLGKLKPLKLDTKGRIRYLSADEEYCLREALRLRDLRIKSARQRGNAWRRERGYPEKPSLDTYTYGDHLTPLILLAINTGLRRSELFHLRWNDIDFQKKVLTVEGSTAKSGQTRHVPLNREAIDILMAWREQAPEMAVVFPGRTNERLDNVTKAWKGVLKTAGITHFTFHDLRHTFACKLAMAGVPLNSIRELLGHADLTMTIRYAHLAPDHKAEAVEKLSIPAIVPSRSVAHG